MIKQEDINKCLEYINEEHHDTFKALAKELRVKISFIENNYYFNDDKETRNIYRITLNRNGKSISFKYGDSIQNTMEGLKPDVYSVLACAGSEYFCPDNFNDFCSEYGYDVDSIKAHSTFKKLLKQSEKLQRIFTEDESRALPS